MTVMLGTVLDVERAIGAQFRTLRLDARFTQAELARRADVSLSAVRGLEAGRGSSLATVIAVARALGRDDWLTGIYDLSPDSPIAQMRRSFGERAPQRVRRPSRGG
jgi:transcriptional regulator with XRE-family HTH domain